MHPAELCLINDILEGDLLSHDFARLHRGVHQIQFLALAHLILVPRPHLVVIHHLLHRLVFVSKRVFTHASSDRVLGCTFEKCSIHALLVAAVVAFVIRDHGLVAHALHLTHQILRLRSTISRPARACGSDLPPGLDRAAHCTTERIALSSRVDALAYLTRRGVQGLQLFRDGLLQLVVWHEAPGVLGAEIVCYGLRDPLCLTSRLEAEVSGQFFVLLTRP